MSGSFWGGVAAGIAGQQALNQRDQELEIHKRKADREEADWAEVQGLKGKFREYGEQEAKDRADAAGAPGVQDGMNTMMADEAIASSDTPLTDEQSAAVRDAYKGKTGSETAANMAVNELKTNIPGATQEQISAVRRGYGLDYKSDPVISLKYAQKRADAAMAAGNIELAQKINKEAKSDGAGHFLAALGSGNSELAMDMYNHWNNGHTVSDMQISPDRKSVTITDKKGTRAVPMDTVEEGAIAMLDPFKAQEMRSNRDLKRETASAALAQRADAERNRHEERLLFAKGNGGGVGSAGSGSGAGGKLAAEPYYKIPGVKDEGEFGKFVERWTGKDAAPSFNGAEGKPVTVDHATYKNAFADTASSLAEGADGKMSADNIGAIAQRIVQAKIANNPKDMSVSVRPLLDATTGDIRMVAKVDGAHYPLRKTPMTEEQLRMQLLKDPSLPVDDKNLKDPASNPDLWIAKSAAIKTENTANAFRKIMSAKDVGAAYAKAHGWSQDDLRANFDLAVANEEEARKRVQSLSPQSSPGDKKSPVANTTKQPAIDKAKPKIMGFGGLPKFNVPDGRGNTYVDWNLVKPIEDDRTVYSADDLSKSF